MTKLGEIKKPWEQWPDETDLSYSYFISYLEIGPGRSLPKVCQKYTKKDSYISQLKKWSSKYDWVERASAYDEKQLLKTLKDKEKEVDKVRAKLLQAAEQAADRLIRISQDDTQVNNSANNAQLKAIEMILDRAGIVPPAPEQLPQPEGESTYQQINNYFYKKMNGKDREQVDE